MQVRAAVVRVGERGRYRGWRDRSNALEVAAVYGDRSIASLTVGFWESENPLHGRPVAIEGDL